jgi:hypothetical protein
LAQAPPFSQKAGSKLPATSSPDFTLSTYNTSSSPSQSRGIASLPCPQKEKENTMNLQKEYLTQQHNRGKEQ